MRRSFPYFSWGETVGYTHVVDITKIYKTSAEMCNLATRLCT